VDADSAQIASIKRHTLSATILLGISVGAGNGAAAIL
jgi:hypothetical protein